MITESILHYGLSLSLLLDAPTRSTSLSTSVPDKCREAEETTR